MNYPYSPGFKTRSPETSVQAAQSFQEDSRTLRKLVFETLKLFPMTADECARKIGKTVLSIRHRLSELSQMELIEDTGERRFNTSGKKAAVWRVRNQSTKLVQETMAL